MNSGDYWRMFFQSWPKAIPRRGYVVTTLNEAVQFTGFLISDGILLLDRDKPDTLGARKVLMAWDAIAALKLTDVLDIEHFQTAGFQPPL